METYAKSLRRNPYLRDMANCERREGRLEGEKKGRMEERMQFAIKLLQRNMSVEDIASLTDLTKEQVQGLL